MAGHRAATVARIALGLIRTFNGTLALVAPGFLLRRLGADPQTSPGATYAFRLFGIRTVILGVELLVARDEILDPALKVAPLIHGTDAAAAAIAGLTGQLPRRAALMSTAISTVNFILALVAASGRRKGVTATVSEAAERLW